MSVDEAKSELSQMLNIALEGERVVITRNGKEAVTFALVQKKKVDWIGMYDEQITIYDDFDDPFSEFEKYL